MAGVIVKRKLDKAPELYKKKEVKSCPTKVDKKERNELQRQSSTRKRRCLPVQKIHFPVYVQMVLSCYSVHFRDLQ
jgi:hypothetical protein